MAGLFCFIPHIACPSLSLCAFKFVMNLDQIFDVSMVRRRRLQDMAKIKVECLEDYLKYMDRMPEIKMVPEKVTIINLFDQFIF